MVSYFVSVLLNNGQGQLHWTGLSKEINVFLYGANRKRNTEKSPPVLTSYYGHRIKGKMISIF